MVGESFNIATVVLSVRLQDNRSSKYQQLSGWFAHQSATPVIIHLRFLYTFVFLENILFIQSFL